MPPSRAKAGTVCKRRVFVAALLLALWPLALEISALAMLAIVNAILWTMIATETRLYGEARYRIRHRIESDDPARSAPQPR